MALHHINLWWVEFIPTAKHLWVVEKCNRKSSSMVMDLTPSLFGACLACFILKKCPLCPDNISSTTPSSECSPRALFQEWKKKLTLIHPDSCPSPSAKLPPISLHPPVIVLPAIRHHPTSVPALLVSHALSSDRLPGHQDPILLDLLRARYIAKMY